VEILWLDPFHGGSHAAVTTGYAANSAHTVRLLTLSQAGGWRWRMRGGAVTLARLAGAANLQPDLIVASDMLDLAVFRALTPRFSGIPAVVYFHENQLTYPLPPGRKRDLGLAWINYTSALVADAALFNSAFHRRSFLAALPDLLGRYHDYQELQTIEQIAAKSAVLTPGVDLVGLRSAAAHQRRTSAGAAPILLWNARWEYDKQPEVFFAALEQLEAQGVDFRLIVAGEHIDPRAPEFAAARARWAPRIVHWGYAPSREAYAALLHQADIVVSTALQEFFGIGVIEALACGCVPVLPRRLSYPELLPAEFHPACLYPTDADLPALLAATIANLPALRRIDWPALAAAYDWTQLAPQYDSWFASFGKLTFPEGSDLQRK
jgi:glycosyltransferase involved in cell wall biosynthesis